MGFRSSPDLLHCHSPELSSTSVIHFCLHFFLLFFFLPLLPFFPCLTGTLDLAFLDICIPCDIPIPVLHSLLNWIVIPHIPRMIVIASHFRSFHHSAYPPPRLLVSLLHQLSLLLDGNTVLLFAALPLSLFSLPHISLFCVQNVHAVNS